MTYEDYVDAVTKFLDDKVIRDQLQEMFNDKSSEGLSRKGVMIVRKEDLKASIVKLTAYLLVEFDKFKEKKNGKTKTKI